MRRKLISAILCVSLLLLLIPGTTASAADNSIVRVKLSMGTPTSVSVFLDGNYSVSGVPLERQMYTVKLENGTLNLYLGSTVVASGASIYLTRNADTPGLNNFMWLRNPHYSNDYLRYLGDMSFSINGSYIQVVNCIYLEYYLYGVVPFEMNDSWPMEALKAQAVAARNYTVRRMSGTGSYDLTDDSSYDQVYRGFNPSYTNAIAAVNTTAGQVLKYGGAVIDAYYSASNGGLTDLPYHRWGGGGDWDYYQIVSDPFDLANPYSLNETMLFPVSIDAGHPISAYGTSTPDVSKALAYIKQVILNSGQLAAYGVGDINGFDLAGITTLAANTYDVSGSQDHSRLPKNGVNNCLDMIRATGDFIVKIVSSGAVVPVTGITLELDYLSGAIGSANNMYVAFSKILGIFVVEPYTNPDGSTGFAISQRRYGHGCGLSQRGAEQRAKTADPNVNTYDKILGFYYPGAVLEGLGAAEPGLTALPSVNRYNATVINDVNVRTGPGTNYDVLAGSEIPPGMRIYVTAPYYTADWHQINYGGTAAYVHKDYVQLDNVMYSGAYPIDRTNKVINIPDQTDAASLVAGIKALGGTVAVYDQSGNPYPAGPVASDMIIRLITNGAIADELKVAISGAIPAPPPPPPAPQIKYGDVNSDGVINITDYTMVRLDILKLKALTDAERQAANVDQNAAVDISDYTLIRLDILGLKKIG